MKLAHHIRPFPTIIVKKKRARGRGALLSISYLRRTSKISSFQLTASINIERLNEKKGDDKKGEVVTTPSYTLSIG